MNKTKEYTAISMLWIGVCIIAMLLIGNNYNAMNKCQETQSHDVCFNSIYR